MVSPQARREQVALACERGLSERRACGLIGLARSSLNYTLRLPVKDAPVIAAMKSLSAQYPRYGYRRIRIFLRRQGLELSWSRTHRIWRQAGLLLPKKRPRRRIASNRPRAYTPFKANAVWAYDFVFDTTAEGQQIKCLTVIDEYTRECLAIDVAGSIRSRRVVEVLSRLVSMHGAPLFMRSDNGPEFVSHAILEWISQAGIATALSDPGKPWQNGADAWSLKPGGTTTTRCVPTVAWTTAHPTNSNSAINPFPTGPSYRNEWLEKAEQIKTPSWL